MSTSDSVTVTYWNLTTTPSLFLTSDVDESSTDSSTAYYNSANSSLYYSDSIPSITTSESNTTPSFYTESSQKNPEGPIGTLITNSLSSLKQIARNLRKYLHQRAFSRQKISQQKPLYPRLRIKKKSFRSQCYFNGQFMRS